MLMITIINNRKVHFPFNLNAEYLKVFNKSDCNYLLQQTQKNNVYAFAKFCKSSQVQRVYF